MSTDPFESLHRTLEEHHDFPCEYVFKFIVPKAQADCMESLLEDCAISRRESKTGKYVSFTARAAMNCSDDVIAVYRKSAEIPGCICM